MWLSAPATEPQGHGANLRKRGYGLIGGKTCLFVDPNTFEGNLAPRGDIMSSHNDSFVASGSSPTPDFIVECHGSIFLLRPLTLAASSWIEENLPQDRMTFGVAVIVEHRYIADIVRAALADGLEIQ